jgi:hypothetical protein
MFYDHIDPKTYQKTSDDNGVMTITKQFIYECEASAGPSARFECFPIDAERAAMDQAHLILPALHLSLRA